MMSQHRRREWFNQSLLEKKSRLPYPRYNHEILSLSEPNDRSKELARYPKNACFLFHDGKPSWP